jgi:hypothetical protein
MKILLAGFTECEESWVFIDASQYLVNAAKRVEENYRVRLVDAPCGVVRS